MSLYAKYRESTKEDESTSPPSRRCTVQLLGLLLLVLLPILGMVVQNAIILNEVSENRMSRRAASQEISFTTYMGRAVHNMAVERGTTSLFIGSQGDTDVYLGLLRKYENTDMAITDLPAWPDVTTDTPWYFRSPDNFRRYLADHRSDVWFKRNETTVAKILFYTAVTEKFISDMGRVLSRADRSQLWTSVVAYQMVVSAKDYAGLERALGSVFFAQGGFSSDELIWYDKVLAVGNANLEDAMLYSDSVVQILEQFRGTSLEANISLTREKIKMNQIAGASVEMGAEWFDLMTQYIGFLRQVEEHLSERVLGIIGDLLAQDDIQLATGYTILLTVVSIGPFIVIGVYKMASETQSVAANLEHVTAKLEQEQKKSDQLLYSVFPAIIVNAMKKADTVPAEYFDEVTVMFSDVVGFTDLTASISPHNVIDLLNRMYRTFDAVLGRYDVYKVESIAGSYMVASGLPTKNGDRHGEQIACAALHLLNSSRPCVAGVVGKKRPRYYVFGNTVSIAQSLEQTGEPNRIQISPSTRELLMSSRDSFRVEPRGDVTIKNSADFVNKIKDIHVEDDETITSYDVCSLFTSIPPKEAVSVVREALEADDTLADRTNLSVDQVCELLELCLGCTYFTYKGQFYQQMHGCAMGSPVSPIVVNLYMEKFENKALSTFNDTPPANWFRYVDDTWCRLKKRVAADFFDHINQIDDNIKFTQEPSHDNMLPFLDTKTIVEEDGNLRFEVYRKPTHTDQYLAFDSHHPLEHKLAVIKTLFHRADNIITSDQAKTDEHRHLRGALAKCGYQNWTFNKALKPSDQSKKTQKCKPLTNKNKANITIPYVQGVSEKLRRIFQNFNIATNFKPHSTLRQRLVHPKDRPHKGTKANVIYRLKCEEPNCNNTYIGETSRPLKVRYKEHCRPSANGYSSAIFHHLQHNQGHSFKLESTDILDRETRWWERGVKEAIYERMYNPTLNREGGLRVDLSGTWDLALPAPRTDNT
ncbi:hypothetical protein Bbelb_059530 [Branchiostoma belcheri]|nr:hypothetical protein Bbelb_059530 [Branchiostoma belcheri]